MSTFAQVLEQLMQAAPPAPRPCTPFEDALRSFEDDVARARLTDAAVAADGTDCEWARALGLGLPCTVADIKRAFRKQALRTHPDCEGGSHAAFLELQSLVREALAAVEAGQCDNRPRARQSTSPYATQPRFERRPTPGRAVFAYA